MVTNSAGSVTKAVIDDIIDSRDWIGFCVTSWARARNWDRLSVSALASGGEEAERNKGELVANKKHCPSKRTQNTNQTGAIGSDESVSLCKVEQCSTLLSEWLVNLCQVEYDSKCPHPIVVNMVKTVFVCSLWLFIGESKYWVWTWPFIGQLFLAWQTNQIEFTKRWPIAMQWSEWKHREERTSLLALWSLHSNCNRKTLVVKACKSCFQRISDHLLDNHHFYW